MTDSIYLLTYRTAQGGCKYMAIYTDDRREAMHQFIANREPTARLIEEHQFTRQQYKDWLNSL